MEIIIIIKKKKKKKGLRESYPAILYNSRECLYKVYHLSSFLSFHLQVTLILA